MGAGMPSLRPGGWIIPFSIGLGVEFLIPPYLILKGFFRQVVVFANPFDDSFGIVELRADLSFQVQGKAGRVVVLGKLSAHADIDFEHGCFLSEMKYPAEASRNGHGTSRDPFD
jgi:hypothetical protein